MHYNTYDWNFPVLIHVCFEGSFYYPSLRQNVLTQNNIKGFLASKQYWERTIIYWSHLLTKLKTSHLKIHERKLECKSLLSVINKVCSSFFASLSFVRRDLLRRDMFLQKRSIATSSLDLFLGNAQLFSANFRSCQAFTFKPLFFACLILTADLKVSLMFSDRQ